MAGSTENSVFIKAPLDLVWDITNDVANWPSLYSEYAKADILDQNPERVVFRLTTVPDENDRTWSWVSERCPDRQSRTVRAKRIDPGPFEYMNIFWSYRESDGGTEMVWKQDFHMRPDAPVDDQGMIDRINRNSPVQMNLIKRRIEAVAAGADTTREQ